MPAPQEPHPEQKQKDRTVAPPSISLPKGGGAIRGMGEKFAANPVTGTGSMTIPIAASPGRAGFGPQLSLSYDSGAGNWIFENGRHKFADKPRTVGDTTYTVRRYRPRIEGLFARIERWASQEDPAPYGAFRGKNLFYFSPDR